MTDIPHSQQSLAPTHQRQASSNHREADKAFLHRILFGLIAATVFSGAVTLALTSEHELVERFQVASTHGPA